MLGILPCIQYFYVLGDNPLDYADSEKDLGVDINSNFNFNDQCERLLSKANQQLFNFLNSSIEPWDGPAAIAATDGKWIIAAEDRNGLRPLRYTLSSDKLLFAGSETGMIQIPHEKILFKGRLGPGQVIGIDLDERKVKLSSLKTIY